MSDSLKFKNTVTNIPYKAGTKEYLREWYLLKKDNYRERYLQRAYGLSIQDIIDLLDIQEHLCVVCKRDLTELTPKNIHIDHNHGSNRIRGVLCNNCNMALGLLKDDVEILKSAINYLEKDRAESATI